MNWQQRKDQQQAEKDAKEALQFHQEQIAKALLEQKIMIENGLRMVEQKYAEDRMMRIKGRE